MNDSDIGKSKPGWKAPSIRIDGEPARAVITIEYGSLSSLLSLQRVLTAFSLAMVVVAFLVSFSAALRLKMHTEPPYWVTGAIPPALSAVAYGHERPYMSLNFVHDAFYDRVKGGENAAQINATIAKILTTYPVAPNRSDRVLSSDDKGIVVMTEWAFRIFGYKVEGVLYLYYVILGISAALFAYSYWRNPFALQLLAAFLLIDRMILPMIKWDGQLGGITALRCMPVLAMIATLHCLMYVFERRVDWTRMVAAVIQVAILVFVIHLRSTAMWEWALVVMGGAAALLLRHGPIAEAIGPNRRWLRRWPTAVPALAALVFFAVLNLHRAYGFPEEYYRGEQIVTRVFWHNIFSGFAFDPGYARRHELKVDDFTTLEATKQYLIERGREKEWEAIIAGKPDYTAMRWQDYEVAAKELFFARCLEHLRDCVATFVYYKPVSMIKNVFWVYGLRKLPPDLDVFVSRHPEIGTVVKQQFIDTTKQLDARRERGRPWIARLLGLVLLFALTALVWRQSEDIRPVLISAGVLAAGSAGPSIIGYPAPHTIAEVALALPLFLVIVPAYLMFSWPAPSNDQPRVAQSKPPHSS